MEGGTALLIWLALQIVCRAKGKPFMAKKPAVLIALVAIVAMSITRRRAVRPRRSLGRHLGHGRRRPAQGSAPPRLPPPRPRAPACAPAAFRARTPVVARGADARELTPPCAAQLQESDASADSCTCRLAAIACAVVLSNSVRDRAAGDWRSATSHLRDKGRGQSRTKSGFAR